MVGPVLLISMDTIRQDVFNSQCFPHAWPIITPDFTQFPGALSSGVATPHSSPGIITGHRVVGDGEFAPGATTITELRSSVEVSPQDFLEPVVGVERQAEEVQIAL